MPYELMPTRFPKAPLGRRGAALAIDFLVAWLISLPLAQLLFAQVVVFSIFWLISRVLIPASNRGQSLGRWALDMKVIDTKYRQVPGIFEFSIREGITLVGAVLLVIGLAGAIASPFSTVLLALPLLIDCAFAWAEGEIPQAFHDRIANTVVVPSQRGYSLDLRLKRWVALLQQRVK